ncbi:MAG: hypothetical protein M3P01_03330 [Actinomycetota bacterium]|nr:hypothetical protein [Actinomycetota bacterium]
MTRSGVRGLKHRRALPALLLVGMVAGVLVVPVAANAAALTTVNWSVSNNQVSATGVSYSYTFKTATTGVIKTITFAVSGAGLLGAPAIARSYGIGAGTVARAGQTITYTVTSGVSVAAGIPIYVEFSGLTNTSTAASYTTSISTNTAVPAVIDGPTASNAVTMGASNTAITVAIDKSLTFTLDTTAFELDMDPSLPALADQNQAVGLTVQTNANSGYTLAVSDNAAGLVSAAAGNPTIPDASSSKATSVAWPGAPAFGYRVTATGATADAAFNAGKFAGYISGGDQVASRATATGGTADTITVTNRVAIDYTVQATVFTDTVTYTVTPNYT